MNPNFYNSNSSGYDQSQPPQFPVIYPPPQETSIEILHDQENKINSVQTFLRKFNRYSFFKTPKVLLLAWDKVFKIKDAFGNKQYKPEDTQELFRELFNDVQNIHEELAEYINTLDWNHSLSMGDEHLDTIPAMESDEFINSSVEDLVPNPRVDEANCDPEEGIHLVERLLYDNSSPRPPEEFVSENSNANIESFFPSPIPNEDKLASNYSLSLPINESFYFDIPSFFCPPAKPPDRNTEILNIKMMGDNSKQKVPIPELMITLASNQKKSPDLLSHRGLKNFQLSAKCSMMIHGKNIPILDVPLFHFYPLDQLKYGENWVKLNDLKQALRGRHPMLISSLVFLFSS
nr:hypothetical protein [Tanacetum cinerariifolium]